MPIRLGFGHMVGNLELTEIPRIFNKFFKISLKMSENKPIKIDIFINVNLFLTFLEPR